MGTAGPLGLARDILDDGSGEPFFVLNRCATLRTSQLKDACSPPCPWCLSVLVACSALCVSFSSSGAAVPDRTGMAATNRAS